MDEYHGAKIVKCGKLLLFLFLFYIESFFFLFRIPSRHHAQLVVRYCITFSLATSNMFTKLTVNWTYANSSSNAIAIIFSAYSANFVSTFGVDTNPILSELEASATGIQRSSSINPVLYNNNTCFALQQSNTLSIDVFPDP